jgi:hypothetical protein
MTGGRAGDRRLNASQERQSSLGRQTGLKRKRRRLRIVGSSLVVCRNLRQKGKGSAELMEGCARDSSAFRDVAEAKRMNEWVGERKSRRQRGAAELKSRRETKKGRFGSECRRVSERRRWGWAAAVDAAPCTRFWAYSPSSLRKGRGRFAPR